MIFLWSSDIDDSFALACAEETTLLCKFSHFHFCWQRQLNSHFSRKICLVPWNWCWLVSSGGLRYCSCQSLGGYLGISENEANLRYKKLCIYLLFNTTDVKLYGFGMLLSSCRLLARICTAIWPYKKLCMKMKYEDGNVPFLGLVGTRLPLLMGFRQPSLDGQCLLLQTGIQ